MNEGVYITFTNTIDDMVAFSLYHSANSPTLKRIRFWSSWGLVMVVLLIAAVLSLLERSFGPLIFIGVWTAIFLAISLPLHKWRVRRATRKMFLEGKNKASLGEHTLRVTDDGLYGSSEVSEGKVLWSGIERIAENDDYLFVYTGAVMALVIPKGRIEAGDLAAFTDELRRNVDPGTDGSPQ